MSSIIDLNERRIGWRYAEQASQAGIAEPQGAPTARSDDAEQAKTSLPAGWRHAASSRSWLPGSFGDPF